MSSPGATAIATVTRDRWAVIAAYALVASANQLLWLTFTPITTPTAHHFGVTASDIGWLSEIFPLLYVILAVPAASLLDRWFHPTLIAGALLTGAGGLLRLGGDTFAWAMAGQVLIAVAQPLILNAITGLASAYLTPASRPAGIALGSAGIFLGMLCSLALGAALGGGSLHTLLVVNGMYGLVGALAVVAVLAVGNRPPITGDVTGLFGMRTVWRDRTIRRLAGVAFIGFGFFVALTTWLQTLLKPAHITATAAGWILVGTVLTGVIGSAVLPPPIIRARADVRLFRIAAGTTAGACILFALWKSVPAIGLAAAVTGFLLLACLPVILEVAERRAGRAGTSATALVWLSGNAGGIVIAIVIQIVVHHPLIAFLVMAAFAAVAVVIAPRETFTATAPEPERVAQ
ncbi:MAG TPA: MFS transporter [Solirubrobacteraceae bacterium]|nr:MFS transporter [Solirubrobacteraceae bacterium]